MKRILIIHILLLMLLNPMPGVAQMDQHATALAWSPDGSLLAVAFTEAVRVFNVALESPQLIWQAGLEKSVDVVQFDPSGQYLVAGIGAGPTWLGGAVHVWDARSGEPITTFAANGYAVQALAFHPNGQQLMIGGGYPQGIYALDYTFHVWDTRSWSEIPTQSYEGRGQIREMVFSPDGRYAAFGSIYGPVTLVNTADYTPLAAIHDGAVVCMAFADDSRSIVVGFANSLQIWEIREQPEVHLVRRNKWFNRYPMSLNPALISLSQYVIGCTADRFVTSSRTGVLRIVNTETWSIEYVYHADGEPFMTAVFSPDGSRLAVITIPTTYAVSILNLEPPFQVTPIVLNQRP
ncbi:MAG: hypothetical protein H6671_00560 [Anaerolineaceae bacterium]|nr:hypothetical protein [Anaerolineaceae bacterium]